MAKNGFSMSNRVAVETVTTGTKTLTADDCGKVVVLKRAAGSSITLPASPAEAGAGWNVTFLVETDVSSNSYGIFATEEDVFIGALTGVSISDAPSTTPIAFTANETTHDAIEMNGTTTGGRRGTRIKIISNGSHWLVNGTNVCSGSSLSPFTGG